MRSQSEPQMARMHFVIFVFMEDLTTRVHAALLLDLLRRKGLVRLVIEKAHVEWLSEYLFNVRQHEFAIAARFSSICVWSTLKLFVTCYAQSKLSTVLYRFST